MKNSLDQKIFRADTTLEYVTSLNSMWEERHQSSLEKYTL